MPLHLNQQEMWPQQGQINFFIIAMKEIFKKAEDWMNTKLM